MQGCLTLLGAIDLLVSSILRELFGARHGDDPDYRLTQTRLTREFRQSADHESASARVAELEQELQMAGAMSAQVCRHSARY